MHIVFLIAFSLSVSISSNVIVFTYCINKPSKPITTSATDLPNLPRILTRLLTFGTLKALALAREEEQLGQEGDSQWKSAGVWARGSLSCPRTKIILWETDSNWDWGKSNVILPFHTHSGAYSKRNCGGIGCTNLVFFSFGLFTKCEPPWVSQYGVKSQDTYSRNK